ncbi:hypothetical protein PITC_095110 [Penicillium italicum]|uniref:Uncharacterized protein n=1 Tax=Penicillium italicum TaxID=40296 RepID=A0A0A2KNI1_PENIT|nr:hypothetical protein PITC_095110 [Penicillium italicum]
MFFADLRENFHRPSYLPDTLHSGADRRSVHSRGVQLVSRANPPIVNSDQNCSQGKQLLAINAHWMCCAFQRNRACIELLYSKVATPERTLLISLRRFSKYLYI